MNKPLDFDQASRDTGFVPLKAGGYVCKILDVKETKSKNSGKDMLEIAIDIAEGEFADYYRKQFARRAERDPKAKWTGVARTMTKNDDGTTHGNFKNFVESVAESNLGWQVQWGDGFCNCFKGKKIGVVFIREEYRKRDGSKGWSVKPDFGHFKTVAQIHEGVPVPPDKKLDEPNVTYSDGALPAGFEVIPDEDVPF